MGKTRSYPIGVSYCAPLCGNASGLTNTLAYFVSLTQNNKKIYEVDTSPVVKKMKKRFALIILP